MAGVRGVRRLLHQLGPLARRVEDLELLLPIIAGPDGEDPHVPPVALGDPDGVDVAGLRVVAFTDNGLRTPTAETIRAVEAAADALTAAGAGSMVPPGLDDAWDAWDGLIRSRWFRVAAAAHRGGRHGRLGLLRDARLDHARPPLPGDELTALIEHADAVRARLLRWIHDVDLIVCPAMPQPAIRHGESTAAWFGDTYSDVHNLTGWPAVVVRGGTSPEGLPIGVQLIAAPWREDVAAGGARIVEADSGGWLPPAL